MSNRTPKRITTIAKREHFAGKIRSVQPKSRYFDPFHSFDGDELNAKFGPTCREQLDLKIEMLGIKTKRLMPGHFDKNKLTAYSRYKFETLQAVRAIQKKQRQGFEKTIMSQIQFDDSNMQLPYVDIYIPAYLLRDGYQAERAMFILKALNGSPINMQGMEIVKTEPIGSDVYDALKVRIYIRKKSDWPK
jgi:hypothetical protein